jgi:hypothetical protein
MATLFRRATRFVPVVCAVIPFSVAVTVLAQPDPGGHIYECFQKCSSHPDILCFGTESSCCCVIAPGPPPVYDCVCATEAACPDNQDDPCP